MGEGRLDRVHFWLCLAAKFCSEKIPWNRLGMVSVIPQKKVLRGIPRFTEESIPKLGTKQNDTKKICLKKSSPCKQNLQRVFIRDMLRNKILRVCYYFCFKERNAELVSLPLNGLEQNSKCLLLFFFRGPEFRVVFSSEEWVQNRIPRVSCLAEQPEFRQNKPIVPSIPSSAE